ncbi:hypothetical protein [Halomonas salifodinae]|uniref:hypothetical protein n=1 Tax=Halomonas salifodinae TaxID=438745 RepID=UPI0033B98883
MNTPGSTTGRKVPDYTDPGYWHGTIKMSLSKFFVLCELHRQPMHGYRVVQAVARTTNGCCGPMWPPSPTAIRSAARRRAPRPTR